MKAVWPILLLCGLLFGGCKDPTARLEQTKERQREAAVAIYSLFVDDCGGLSLKTTEQAQYLPDRLTTPIAYLDAENLVDPFAPDGARFLLLLDTFYGNGARVAVVSRGPDRDLDSLRLPPTLKHRAPKKLKAGTEYYLADTGQASLNPWVARDDYVYRDVSAYIDENGNRVENPLIPIIMLPERKEYSRDLPPQEYVDWFLANDVPFYDPTNGIYSNGDLVQFYQ